MMAPDAPNLPAGPIVVFDDDHYYMAAVLAEKLAADGRAVTLVTTAGKAAAWGIYTEEDYRTNQRLLELGVVLRTNSAVSGYANVQATSVCIYTGRETKLEAAALITVTSRQPDDELHRALRADPASLKAAGIEKLMCLGDASAPALIAHAVYAGHRFARELDAGVRDIPFKREAATV